MHAKYTYQMSSSSDDEGSWHPSESSEEEVRSDSPPASESELVEPKKKKPVEVLPEPDSDDAPKKRKPEKHHERTGRPRGVQKGHKYPARKLPCPKHIRENIDGVAHVRRQEAAEKKQALFAKRREHVAEKINNRRTGHMTAEEEECFNKYGALPRSIETIICPADPVVPTRQNNIELINAKRIQERLRREEAFANRQRLHPHEKLIPVYAPAEPFVPRITKRREVDDEDL